MDIGTLKQRQSLPLEMKIQKSIKTLETFYEMYEGNVYISTSGIDSAVVVWLAQQSLETKDIERVCVASVEPVENIRLNKDRGDTLLKSVVSKKKLIREWGYPLISKEVAMKLSRYTRTKYEWVKERRLHGYIGTKGQHVYEGIIPLKYQEFIYAPFEFTEKCCDKVKKAPLKKWEKANNKKPITGELAEESRDRKKNYLKHGCIMVDKKRIKCTPLGFWTNQDILRCVYENNIEIPKIYGEVVQAEDGTFSVTGEPRTGCTICAFGQIRDEERFDRLKEKKLGLYNEMMRGGEWIRKGLYRWVKFRPGSMPIWSNLYWVPNDKGYGYRFVLNYMYTVLKIDKHIERI